MCSYMQVFTVPDIQLRKGEISFVFHAPKPQYEVNFKSRALQQLDYISYISYYMPKLN